MLTSMSAALDRRWRVGCWHQRQPAPLAQRSGRPAEASGLRSPADPSPNRRGLVEFTARPPASARGSTTSVRPGERLRHSVDESRLPRQALNNACLRRDERSHGSDFRGTVWSELRGQNNGRR